jgi:hypothetical protein
MEKSHAIGTGSKTVSAPDTPVGVYDHNPIFPLVGRLNRTHWDTTWILTIIAHKGKEEAGHMGECPLLDLLDPAPPHTERNIVLHLACNRTCMTPYTSSKVYEKTIPHTWTGKMNLLRICYHLT